MSDGAAPADERIPLTLLTGFLGSGKTTLLSRLLRHPDMGETAVIVNELGEVGIDHHLLTRVDERTVLLDSGCLCCTLRGDLADELRSLIDRMDAGEIPRFRRVAVETTGLAEPAPILFTLLTDQVVQTHYRLDGVVTTVDAVNGLDQLERQPEAAKQAAVADRLVVTKADIAAAGAPERLAARLRAINPHAALLTVVQGDIHPAALLAAPVRDLREVADELAAAGAGDGAAHDHAAHGHAHHHHHHGPDDVHAFSIVLDEPLDWTAFGVWLSMLLQAHGESVLRVKGLLDVGGDGPLLLNGVQHVVHPPQHLPEWPDADHRSRLVVIARGIGEREVRDSLVAFDRAARTA
jgi:G3E family GTPase